MIYVFITLLFIILVFGWFYYHGIRISVLTKIDHDICIRLLWYYPLFQAYITLNGTVPVIEVLIFNIRVIKKNIIGKKRTVNFNQLLQSIRASHIRIKTIYCLDNPYYTGILCSAFNVLLPFLDIEEILHVPDFRVGEEYIRVEAEALINIRHSMLNFADNKNKKGVLTWSKI